MASSEDAITTAGAITADHEELIGSILADREGSESINECLEAALNSREKAEAWTKAARDAYYARKHMPPLPTAQALTIVQQLAKQHQRTQPRAAAVATSAGKPGQLPPMMRERLHEMDAANVEHACFLLSGVEESWSRVVPATFGTAMDATQRCTAFEILVKGTDDEAEAAAFTKARSGYYYYHYYNYYTKQLFNIHFFLMAAELRRFVVAALPEDLDPRARAALVAVKKLESGKTKKEIKELWAKFKATDWPQQATWRDDVASILQVYGKAGTKVPELLTTWVDAWMPGDAADAAAPEHKATAPMEETKRRLLAKAGAQLADAPAAWRDVADTWLAQAYHVLVLQSATASKWTPKNPQTLGKYVDRLQAPWEK